MKELPIEKKPALVVLAAGLSSRFGGRPKGLIPVDRYGRGIVGNNVERAIEAGIGKIIFVVSTVPGRDTFQSYYNNFSTKYQGFDVNYAFQDYSQFLRDKPWGAADALISAFPHINGPFIVCNADDLYDYEDFKQIVDCLAVEEYNAIMCYPLFKMLPPEGKVSRGIVISDHQGLVQNIIEHHNLEADDIKRGTYSQNTLSNANFFGFHYTYMRYLQEVVFEFKYYNSELRDKEFPLSSAVNSMQEDEVPVKILHAEGDWIGITNPGDELLVEKHLEKQC